MCQLEFATTRLPSPLGAFPPNCGTYGKTGRLLPYSSANGRGTRNLAYVPPHPTIISHHIGVIPMSRPSVSYDDVLVVSIVVDGSLHRAPRVLDVVEVSPEIAGVDD